MFHFHIQAVKWFVTDTEILIIVASTDRAYQYSHLSKTASVFKILSVSFKIAMHSSLLTPSNKDSMPSATSAFTPIKNRKKWVCVCFWKAKPAVKRPRRVQEKLWNVWPPRAPGDARLLRSVHLLPQRQKVTVLAAPLAKLQSGNKLHLTSGKKQIKNKKKSHFPSATCNWHSNPPS